jgi:hypothetical protein
VIEIIDEPWEALERLCHAYAAKHLDILTGYIGRGATQALAMLGVHARIVLGLESENAALTAAQIEELRLLCTHHEVRWRRGLHAKLYVIEQRAALVGSANFTRSGFEKLDEVAIVTDDATAVEQAIDAFEIRFAEAVPLDPDRLQVNPATSSDDADGLPTGLGTAWDDRHSGFTRASPGHGSSREGDEAPAYFVNIGEGRHRCWADSRRYGFISAGQGQRFSDQLHQLPEGAQIYAYLREHGYVGAGRVLGPPRMARNHVIPGTDMRLFDLELHRPGLRENADDPARCEWVVPVQWQQTLDRDAAVLKPLFRRGFVVCRLKIESHRRALADAFLRPPPADAPHPD